MVNLRDVSSTLKEHNINIKYNKYDGWCTSVSVDGCRINKIGFNNVSDAIIQCSEIINGHLNMV